MNDEQYFNSDNMAEYPREIHPSVKFGKNVTIGMSCILEEGVIVGDNCFIGHHVLVRPNSKIGNGVGIRSFCLLDPDVEVGDRTQIYPHATVGGGTKIGKDVYYGPYTLTTNSSEPGVINPPVIGDNAIIYAGCMIGPGVKVGVGAIVGMGSTLTKSVPAMELWYGDSARYRRKVNKKDHGLKEKNPWPYSIEDVCKTFIDYHESMDKKRNKKVELN